jgi:hypothetical protein
MNPNPRDVDSNCPPDTLVSVDKETEISCRTAKAMAGDFTISGNRDRSKIVTRIGYE